MYYQLISKISHSINLIKINYSCPNYPAICRILMDYNSLQRMQYKRMHYCNIEVNIL